MAGVPISNLSAELGPNSELGKALTAALPGRVSLPGSDQFNASNGSYYSAFENEIVPAAIAHPTSVAEVATLIKTLKPLLLGQPSGSPKLAIRGAGHAPHPGAANAQDGATVDMRGLKGIKLSHDKTTVSIAAGETWDKVYEALAPEGLTVAGGRVTAVGVTGFLLGGESTPFGSVAGPSLKRGYNNRRAVVFLDRPRLRRRQRNQLRAGPRLRGGRSGQCLHQSGHLSGGAGRLEQLWHRHALRHGRLPTDGDNVGRHVVRDNRQPHKEPPGAV